MQFFKASLCLHIGFLFCFLLQCLGLDLRIRFWSCRNSVKENRKSYRSRSPAGALVASRKLSFYNIFYIFNKYSVGWCLCYLVQAHVTMILIPASLWDHQYGFQPRDVVAFDSVIVIEVETIEQSKRKKKTRN